VKGVASAVQKLSGTTPKNLDNVVREHRPGFFYLFPTEVEIGCSGSEYTGGAGKTPAESELAASVHHVDTALEN